MSNKTLGFSGLASAVSKSGLKMRFIRQRTYNSDCVYYHSINSCDSCTSSSIPRHLCIGRSLDSFLFAPRCTTQISDDLPGSNSSAGGFVGNSFTSRLRYSISFPTEVNFTGLPGRKQRKLTSRRPKSDRLDRLDQLPNFFQSASNDQTATAPCSTGIPGERRLAKDVSLRRSDCAALDPWMRTWQGQMLGTGLAIKPKKMLIWLICHFVGLETIPFYGSNILNFKAYPDGFFWSNSSTFWGPKVD